MCNACAIGYHLCNLKNAKNSIEECHVLQICSKSNASSRLCFTFFKIVQIVANRAKRFMFSDAEFVCPNSRDREQKLLANRRIQKTAKHQRWRFTQKAPSMIFCMFLITPLSRRSLLYFAVLERC